MFIGHHPSLGCAHHNRSAKVCDNVSDAHYMRGHRTFDPRLKTAGFSDQQAEAIADATRDLIADEIVTKRFLASELDKLSMRLTIRITAIAAIAIAAMALIKA
jgi:hypothetical protein